MANNKLSFLLILLFNLLLSVKSELDEDTYIKTLAFMSIITERYKHGGEGQEEPNIYSPTMLSCFIKISPDQAQEILSNMDQGASNLEPEEIYELTNTDILKELSQEELNINSKELENAINEFQKMDEENGRLKQTNFNDNSKNGGIWGSITNIIDKIFITRSTNNFWIALAIITVLMCTLFYMKNDENLNKQDKKEINSNKEINSDKKKTE